MIVTSSQQKRTAAQGTPGHQAGLPEMASNGKWVKLLLEKRRRGRDRAVCVGTDVHGGLGADRSDGGRGVQAEGRLGTCGAWVGGVAG